MTSWVDQFNIRLNKPSTIPPGDCTNRHVVIYQVGLSQKRNQCHKHHHIYALCVVERGRIKKTTPVYLTPKPMSVHGLNGFTVGVVRHQVSITAFRKILAKMEKTQVFEAGNSPLSVEGLKLVSETFARSDSTTTFPINKILSNNFDGGCFIQSYSTAIPLKGLSELLPNGLPCKGFADTLQKLPSVDLSAVPEQIGNLIIQFRGPPLAVRTKRSQEGTSLIVKGVWKSNCPPLDLRLIAVFDDDVSMPVNVAGATWNVEINNFRKFQHFRLDIQDSLTGELIYGKSQTGWLENITLRMNSEVGGTSGILQIDGQQETVRRVSSNLTSVGNEISFQRQRQIKAGRAAELAELEKRSAFLSYVDGRKAPNHDGAINDLNLIIQQHGQKGAWIWDPYLNGHDILKTLGRSVYTYSDLRGLSDRKSPPSKDESSTPKDLQSWITEQLLVLNDGLQNMQGVKLQFRVRTGQRGYKFHDRFLILPQSNGDYLAWSLGTSINALGKQHHIIQQIEHANQIADSFLRLWNDLEKDPMTSVWPKA